MAMWSITLPLLVGLFRYKRFTAVPKVVWYFVLVSTVFELVSGRIADLGDQNTDFIPYFVAIETLFLSWVYRKTLDGVWKKIIVAALILILITSLISILSASDSDTFSSNLRLVQTGVFIVLSLVYFYQLFDHVEIKALGKEPMFWFNTGFFIYFCGALFFFVASITPNGEEFIQEEIEFFHQLFIIHSLVMVIRNILLTIGFWRIPK